MTATRVILALVLEIPRGLMLIGRKLGGG